ncbi:unnamed protein product [Lactuca saligna]|uniref:Uncharacterized protein n=1 Tax=Lactuca saligna TaxID=75948 RepID=A0AA35ZYG0_LACSI|nr:unnamed protein product [Lactuca saligna]
MLLAPTIGTSDARGGEIFVTSWKRSSDFQLRKTISDEEKKNWSSWPSILVDSFKHNREMENIKMKLIFYAFRVTQSMPPIIPSPKIVQINEVSPINNDDDLPTP